MPLFEVTEDEILWLEERRGGPVGSARTFVAEEFNRRFRALVYEDFGLTGGGYVTLSHAAWTLVHPRLADCVSRFLGVGHHVVALLRHPKSPRDIGVSLVGREGYVVGVKASTDTDVRSYDLGPALTDALAFWQVERGERVARYGRDLGV
jgi:hypothetical protein